MSDSDDDWGCEYCRNDGALFEGRCPKCDAEYLDEDAPSDGVSPLGTGLSSCGPRPAVVAVPASIPDAAVGIEHSPTVRRIVGPTILLSSGEYFDFLNPRGSVFGIEDIAHGLSHICRFAGHCREFYSVAQHSVYVSHLVPPEHAFAGLMHDAAEAFVGDVAKPLKDLLPEYRAIEHAIEAVVLARFGLSLPLHPSVKEADIVMLATEQLALMQNRDDWQYTRGRKPADIEIKPMGPVEARSFFLARFHELTPQGDAPDTPCHPDSIKEET